MAATLIFDGLCALVSDQGEAEDIPESTGLTGVLIDAGRIGQPRHAPALDFLRTDFLEGNRELLQDHPEDPPKDPRRYRVDLQSWHVRIHVDAGPSAFTVVDPIYIPHLAKACGRGRIHPDCFDDPGKKPVAALLVLPFGEVQCGHDVTAEEWMFDPPVGSQYCQKFCQEVRLHIAAAAELVFDLKPLTGAGAPARLVLRPSFAIRITNEPEDPELRAMEKAFRHPDLRRSLPADRAGLPPLDHSISYYEVLDQEPNGRPTGRRNPGCLGKPGTLNDGGIGCVPFLLVRNETREAQEAAR